MLAGKLETYAVVVLDGLGDEGVDEQGQLLLCWCHLEGLALGFEVLRSVLVAIVLRFEALRLPGIEDLDREIRCTGRSGLPVAICRWSRTRAVEASSRRRDEVGRFTGF